ncbi:uncharacterized protein CIMG_10300 [Coccidioides immitis RS]|uniref:HMG box domain-containing protein n=2 Tax=Coccidioides immitis TaxID=5501 RepID=J3K176_COCIM|nr:uncharacterized protein CIMG_10300 [Coccidioides immitis RS]EAS27695.3 hypothetical protein CIMG_10300 [Coccidioides immitis RS]KMP09665.1 hypothetical protein CIRG_09835 [Coccidioides immitis RMSCC 2394]TPX20440.1 hypothetical protein DIZ76_016328 [Coccidioides immitis]
MNSILSRGGPTAIRRIGAHTVQQLTSLARNSNGIRFAPAVCKAKVVVLPFRLRNTYTTAARPKAHTGRAVASKTTKAKKPAATQAKKKRTTKTKTATGKKPQRKALTDKQKAQLENKKRKQEIKDLKLVALSPPKMLPNNSFGLVLQQVELGTVAQRTEAYRKMSESERERLREAAKSNAEANRATFEAWVKNHTPLQIKEANNARRKLRNLLDKPRSFPDIRDPRQVKRPLSAYIIFAKEQLNSAELANLTVTEKMMRIGKSWRDMTKAGQEKYHRLHADAIRQYVNEYESVYGEPPKRASPE